MAMTNRERVGRALELLGEALLPFVAREIDATRGKGWLEQTMRDLGVRPDAKDPQFLLKLMREGWNETFGRALGRAERTYVFELSDVRNAWAHMEAFSSDDADRALDTAARLLRAVSAADQAAEVDKLKHELRRQVVVEQARQAQRRQAAAALEGTPAAGLRPWREVVTPHPDVASGRYQTAEFAADLGQVHRGEGAEEYLRPDEFFRRTFLTLGLEALLANALRRLGGGEGDPVVELQTNFGGGKTHAMLALYHLASGARADDLAGVPDLLARNSGLKLVEARRAVLVGTALSPGQPRRKPDGTEVRTLWGELAWQLLGADGYALVAGADRTGVSPGSAELADLFAAANPGLILLDEWVAYVRQLYGVDGLPGGSFDANLTFAQALTEAAKQAPRTLVVASLPASDIEIGGEGGRAALERLRNVFSRVQSPWRPASTEEGFEIVRRRLFEPIVSREATQARLATAKAFADYYRAQPGEFPPEAREDGYRRRLEAAYPIHPELFDRLFEDWSSLEGFQRTRGVLRLMAAVIHALWERDDRGLLILPASIPVDAPAVREELTRYLEDNWLPVIERDVDGVEALPKRLDAANANFGRYSAARRVARTLYLGSAPTLKRGTPGVDDRSVKLGSAQPGETVATFGDALRRLADEATHLYATDGRYWFGLQPSVNRLAQDRAAQVAEHDADDEIVRRVREQVAKPEGRGGFGRIHPCPAASGDVPDERETRLVILGPDFPHAGKDPESPARRAAEAMLQSRGESPRRFRNALVWLAPDAARLAELREAARRYLAWASIVREADALDLSPSQRQQAETKRADADQTVRRRLPETFQWLLAPEAEPGSPDVAWREIRLQGDEPLAARAFRKLRGEGLVALDFGPANLRLDLDRVPLWRGDHVALRQLVDDYAQYLYLQRQLDPEETLPRAVREGAARMLWETETFATADRWDEAGNRYVGLRAGADGEVRPDEHAVVVAPAAARRQLDAAPYPAPGNGHEQGGRLIRNGGAPYEAEGAGAGTATLPESTQIPQNPQNRRFHGSVRLDPMSMSTKAAEIAQAVVAHLAAQYGAEVEVSLEIHARFPEDAPEQLVRTVTENCRTLKFESAGFEAG